MAVFLDMRLAGFGGMVMGVMAVARSGMGVMRRGLGVFVFVVLRSFAMMMRGLFVMVGGVVMMLAGGMLVRHGELPEFCHARMTQRNISLGGIGDGLVSDDVTFANFIRPRVMKPSR
ncbi:MAG TPA: hypothetical protein VHZ32_12385 [Rhizomicrobium sp.]|nr:hypothetical protein [Rhizomicrobium sp.]